MDTGENERKVRKGEAEAKGTRGEWERDTGQEGKGKEGKGTGGMKRQQRKGRDWWVEGEWEKSHWEMMREVREKGEGRREERG